MAGVISAPLPADCCRGGRTRNSGSSPASPSECSGDGDGRYRRAAEQGHAPAQDNLGRLYLKGRGVKKDYALAYMWLELAISNGRKSAAKYLNQVVKTMTQEQISNARMLARTCAVNDYKGC
jgi:hypothetical protein